MGFLPCWTPWYNLVMFIEPVKIYLICLLLGYLLGNLQFAIVFSHLLYHDDVREHGSGNAGSTNMLRVFGLKSGLLTFIGDFLKGVAAVLIGRSLGGAIGSYCMALGAILGHDFPALLKFKGGKGVATSMGIAVAIQPWIGIVAIAAGIGMVAYSKMVSVGSLTGGAMFLLLTLPFGADPWVRLLALLACLLIVLRHWENIYRIRTGQENRISFKKKG